MKKTTIVIGVLVLVAVAFGVYWLNKSPAPTVVTNNSGTTTPTGTTTPNTKEKTVIGTSVGGRDIEAYHYGTGSKELLFVGGIHGGYEWNTVLVAHALMDYLKANPAVIPSGVKVTVIPVLNPDGLAKVVGTAGRFTGADITTNEATIVEGRFNNNNVDLNRNFDCDWHASGVWQNKRVSGGSKPFSEPESQAIKAYTDTHKPTAVIVWYSAVGGVFSSNCHNGVLAETRTLTKIYAQASGYPSYETFDYYKITGDMVNWFAKNNIPAISVLLTTHDTVEWNKNQAGVKAVLAHYGN